MGSARAMYIGPHSRLNGHGRLNELLTHLRLDPRIRARQAGLERNPRLPAQHLAQPRVVGVAPAYALRTGDVPFRERHAGRRADEVGQMIDRHEPVLAEIERVVISGRHHAREAVEAVVDVAERARLLAVAPDLDL